MPPNLFGMLWQAFPIGLASGFLAGAFGVGGGVLMIPMSRHFLGVLPHVAIGTSLAVIVPTALVGLANYLKKGELVIWLAVASGVPAMVTTLISSKLAYLAEGKVLMLSLCSLMLLMGFDFATGFGAKIRAGAGDQDVELKRNRKTVIIAASVGLIIGVLSGMLGIGGGFLIVPSFCYFLKTSLKTAFGTSLAVVAMVALPGAFVHASESRLDLQLAVPLLCGTIPGAWLGSFCSLKAKEKALKIAFGLVLIVLALYFGYREIFG